MSVEVNISNLSKQFGETVALRDIDLNIQAGELFGFIGPDGSGKTTLFRILTGLLLADNGKALVNGWDAAKDYRQIRTITGYMPGRFSLYADLTVEENIAFYASIFNTSLKENYNLIKDIYSHIEPFKKRRAGDLSGGMKQKLALSCALIHKPEILILDEPTTGVDAVSRREFWELLKKMQQTGITILVSTPYMDEASRCDRVALIQNGNLLAVNPPKLIISEYPYSLYAVRTSDMYELPADLHEMDPEALVYRFGDTVHLSSKTAHGKTYIKKTHSFLAEAGHAAISVIRQDPVIEDCFLALMDKSGTS
jgi:ABC-2 type transport system ATP-binding protein